MNNSCYLVGYNHQTERDQAQKMCENDGANLASIHSQEENDFIFQLVANISVTILSPIYNSYCIHSPGFTSKGE